MSFSKFQKDSATQLPRVKPRRRDRSTDSNAVVIEMRKPTARPASLGPTTSTVDDQMNKELSLLIVEDDAADAVILRKVLGSCNLPLKVRVATTYQSFRNMARLETPDVVLLDLGLSDCEGLEGIKAAVKEFPDIPIVVLTGLDHEPTARVAIECGAQDYLLKPQVDGLLLRSRLIYAVQRHQLKKADQELIQHLEQAASTDQLTGLLNRSSLHAESCRQYRIAKRNGSPLSIGMIDIDYFKIVNDTHGHYVGDQVLEQFAKKLTELFRASDIVGRIGGEEFCCILPSTDREQASIWGLRICEAIRNATFETEAGPLSITCSIGVATLDNSINDVSDLVAIADAAARNAKRNGRDRVASDLTIRSSSLSESRFGEPKSVFSSMDRLTARELMLPLVTHITGKQTVRDATVFMMDLRLDALAVLDEDGGLLSLLSEEDIVAHLLRGGAWDAPVTMMASRAVCFPEQASVGKVWEFFQRVPVRRLVIESTEGEPVGIINRSQILRWCFNLTQNDEEILDSDRNHRQRIHDMSEKLCGELLANLSNPNCVDEVSLIATVSSLQDILAQTLQHVASSGGRQVEENQIRGISGLL